jgi:hypothetical protein
MRLSIIQKAIILTLASFTVATGSSTPTVNLGYAQYEGIRDDTLGYVLPFKIGIPHMRRSKLELAEQSTSITAYYGLHYAAAPTGQLRWQAPVDIEKRNNYSKRQVLKATAPGPQCLQLFPEWKLDTISAAFTQSNSISREDCLLLDILVPSVPKNTSLPVIVQIHGGGKYCQLLSFNAPYQTIRGPVCALMHM